MQLSTRDRAIMIFIIECRTIDDSYKRIYNENRQEKIKYKHATLYLCGWGQHMTPHTKQLLPPNTKKNRDSWNVRGYCNIDLCKRRAHGKLEY